MGADRMSRAIPAAVHEHFTAAGTAGVRQVTPNLRIERRAVDRCCVIPERPSVPAQALRPSVEALLFGPADLGTEVQQFALDHVGSALGTGLGQQLVSDLAVAQEGEADQFHQRVCGDVITIEPVHDGFDAP